MVDSERREQILQAEAAIRQLAERMGENIAGRAESKEAANALRVAAHTLSEANGALSTSAANALRMAAETVSDANGKLRASAAMASEAQKLFVNAQEALRAMAASIAKTSGEEAREFRGRSVQVISDLESAGSKMESSITSIQTAGEVFQATCTQVLQEYGEKQTRAIEDQKQVLEQFGRTQTETIGAGQQLVAANLGTHIQNANAALNQCFTVLSDGLEVQRAEIDKFGRQQTVALEAGQRRLLTRINWIGGVSLIVMVALLTLR